MQQINVHRYQNPRATGWAGWIEPDDKRWIAFIGLDGVPRVFLNRHPETGAVLPDDPVEREEQLRILNSERPTKFGYFHGMRVDPAGEVLPGGPHAGSADWVRDTGQHTGEANDGSATWPEGERDPLERGETIFPLGVDGTGGVGVEPLKAK